jgi:thioredoxin-related protein
MKLPRTNPITSTPMNGQTHCRRTSFHPSLCLLVLVAYFSQAHASPSHEASGIAWYGGNVADAFQSARAAKKPVFLYWGAKWCPPCQQLKAFVFTRSDFVEKSKQFVAVYLDGDDPGAQKWGEKFHVLGYPTVVILRWDQKEITRISGGTDLSSYAELLDAALRDIKPMADVLSALHDNPAALTSSDCQRLTYYSWSDREFSDAELKPLAKQLAEAAQACSNLTEAERARLVVSSAALSPTAETAAQVIAIVNNAEVASQVVDALEGLQEPFFSMVRSKGASTTAQFQEAWIRTLDRVASDATVDDADQLVAIGMKLSVVKQFSVDKKVPAAMAMSARGRAAAALAKRVDPYVRAGIVNSASFIYEQLGDEDAEYALLKSEMGTAKAPYYYMGDLADVEEKRGHPQEALAWYERAYRESQGVATRFQWGVNYLAALLRLAPTDRERIRRVGIEVIAELDGPDRIQARTRMRLSKLDSGLRRWNASHRYDADIKMLHARMQGVCAKLPDDDSGRDSCKKFLS